MLYTILNCKSFKIAKYLKKLIKSIKKVFQSDSKDIYIYVFYFK